MGDAIPLFRVDVSQVNVCLFEKRRSFSAEQQKKNVSLGKKPVEKCVLGFSETVLDESLFLHDQACFSLSHTSGKRVSSNKEVNTSIEFFTKISNKKRKVQGQEQINMFIFGMQS